MMNILSFFLPPLLLLLPPPLVKSTQTHTDNKTRGVGGGERKIKKPKNKKQTFVNPPSTTKSVPLTNPLSSLASHSTACACSMASPKRPVGKWISRRWRLALSVPRKVWRRGVLWFRLLIFWGMGGREGKLGEGRGGGGGIYLRGAGQRALKRMSSRAWTMASSRVRARTAPLLLVFRQSEPHTPRKKTK